MLQSWIDAARDKESFRYTSLQPLLALPFQPPPPTSLSIDKLPLITAADAPRQRLVFVDGVLRQEGRLKDGRYTGTEWQRNKFKGTSLTTYKDGEQQGAEQRYDEDGKLVYFSWHDKGHSPIATSWYSNGKLKDHN
ncbi:MAG: hypothetical protein EBZ69_05925, partial [Alphaproteobacteria bacterium]|nr:hypothetical protein [Alphaproteobacteria bacterium]